MKFNLESGHCWVFFVFVWVVRTGVDSSGDRGCNAQPASQTFFHVHVYLGSGPVHPHSTFHRRSRCRRWGNSQTAHGFQHHQAPRWWFHHPPVWPHTPNLLLHVAWPQWHAYWIPTSELLTYSTEELWGHSLFYFLRCRKQLGVLFVETAQSSSAGRVWGSWLLFWEEPIDDSSHVCKECRYECTTSVLEHGYECTMTKQMCI